MTGIRLLRSTEIEVEHVALHLSMRTRG